MACMSIAVWNRLRTAFRGYLRPVRLALSDEEVAASFESKVRDWAKRVGLRVEERKPNTSVFFLDWDPGKDTTPIFSQSGFEEPPHESRSDFLDRLRKYYRTIYPARVVSFVPKYTALFNQDKEAEIEWDVWNRQAPEYIAAMRQVVEDVLRSQHYKVRREENKTFFRLP